MNQEKTQQNFAKKPPEICIVPTITAENPPEFARQYDRVKFAPRLHIDIADGIFAPNATVNLNQIYWDEQEISLHLMIDRPSFWLHQIVALMPKTAILHAECQEKEKLPEIFSFLRKNHISCGLAILPETRIADIENLAKIADKVLIFGGKLGFQGGEADLSQLSKIRDIRALNQNAKISYDGGANLENVREIAAHGAEIINFGSAIMNVENPRAMYQKLCAAANGE